METSHTEGDFREFVQMVGPWFEGMAKFAGIMARHNDEIYTGERLMIQRLVKETFKLDKYMKGLNTRFKAEDAHLLAELVGTAQERLLDQGLVGAALAMTSDEVWAQVLTDSERQCLERLTGPEPFVEACLSAPLRALFVVAQHLDHLPDDPAGRLLTAAVTDGAVSVVIGTTVTPVSMAGCCPRVSEDLSLADLLASGAACTIDFGGFQVTHEDVTSAA